MDSQRHQWTLQMTRRVRFTGRLRMKSALHVGGGVGTTSVTDAGVVRHPDGKPFIPGSSLKGALRSHLERLSQVEGLRERGITSCALYNPSETDCPTPGWIDSGQDATQASESDFEKLCHTCTLFGSPILAGKIRVPDLEVDEASFAGRFEVRDGVGIDRDSGQAVDGVKFDYEVVPSGTVFHFEISVESPDATELGLLAAGVRELQRGHLPVGGKTTRGLGACALEDLTIYDAELDSLAGLERYLKSRADGTDLQPVDDPDAFLDDCIEALFD